MQSFRKILLFLFGNRNSLVNQNQVIKCSGVFENASQPRKGKEGYSSSSALNLPTSVQDTTVTVENNGISKMEIPKIQEKVKIYFLNYGSTELIQAEGVVGESIIKVALRNDVGFEGCEGKMSCKLCHMYVDDRTLLLYPAPEEQENDALDSFEISNWKDNSRLSCQITLNKELEGTVFTVPEIGIEFIKKLGKKNGRK
ncbi:hypothetical protein NPIL_407541 [Nephila pilipes]|uniref:2Fe-2S ferredoxin-type domain-containing protein n=1 Tax=Nephila pilipes TaxID=299642 RepID=A0A8X6TXV4_NEPPI|nr:hypothetical protein NPIL_407541 [Nephila pilipes]